MKRPSSDAITAFTISSEILSMSTQVRWFLKSFWSRYSTLRFSISGVHLTGTNLYNVTQVMESRKSPAGRYSNNLQRKTISIGYLSAGLPCSIIFSSNGKVPGRRGLPRPEGR